MTDPNERESHNIGFLGIFKLVLIFLIIIFMILGILWVAKIITQATLIDYAIKIGSVGGIVLLASALIAMLGGRRE